MLWTCPSCGLGPIESTTGHIRHACRPGVGVPIRRPGAGSKLKKLVSYFGIYPDGDCQCEAHAYEMDIRGTEWCRSNIETIIGWLVAEGERRSLPFPRQVYHQLALTAIKLAEGDVPRLT